MKPVAAALGAIPSQATSPARPTPPATSGAYMVHGPKKKKAPREGRLVTSFFPMLSVVERTGVEPVTFAMPSGPAGNALPMFRQTFALRSPENSGPMLFVRWPCGALPALQCHARCAYMVHGRRDT